MSASRIRRHDAIRLAAYRRYLRKVRWLHAWMRRLR